ncbi:MAG: metallophosphoesterase [Hamadaea sp.]|uniref:metallophosphoesterase n=1 Tax=Hamadaea sp. TaxID=2024425 RepID=UPI001836FEDC|nr:metallophosphoesterase [Hamadaea sp.]NUR74034.1 metallophosphoesterase [Hamadaea sp.]NUT19490.1 metallophosphoesterase [Hamadaea sp.]
MGSLGKIAAGVVVAGAATFAYASLVERNRFTLRRFEVPVLAPEAEPLRILHLSDLHMTPGQTRKQRWVAQLAGLDPDLVIVTGDNMAHPGVLPTLSQALEPLLAYPGAFVFGSNDYSGPVWKSPFSYFGHDPEVDGGETYRHGAELPHEELRALFTSAGWSDLNNARDSIKAGGRVVDLVGVDDPHIDRDDYPGFRRTPEAALAIGVSHTPEPRVLDEMAADGCDLLLAGHTHGGQVRVPGVGALVTNCGLDRSMARGLHRWLGTDAWLHVSAGLGTHPTAPVRFACLPEASILTLIPR